MVQTEQEDRRLYNILTVFALLIRCPATGVVMNGICPFAEFRNGCELEEKFQIAETLPDEKCREMLGFHDSCLAGAGRNPDRQAKRPDYPPDTGGPANPEWGRL